VGVNAQHAQQIATIRAIQKWTKGADVPGSLMRAMHCVRRWAGVQRPDQRFGLGYVAECATHILHRTLT
jgi:hypothetical protein